MKEVEKKKKKIPSSKKRKTKKKKVIKVSAQKNNKKIKRKKTEQIQKVRKQIDFSFINDFFMERKSTVFRTFRIPLIILIILLVLYIVFRLFTVTTVVVEGNVHYSIEEIEEMVMGDKYGNNSIYLFLKYRNKQIENVPFIESMSVNIESPNKVKIKVYEKSLAGFVQYLDKYFYFDQDGTIVESSDVVTQGVPQIIGLEFDHVILHEPLDVDDQSIFIHILDISHLLKKYEIMADKIYFDQDYKITLFLGDCRIKLGSTDYIDEKIMKLKLIIPEIQGKKGVLQMENYSPDSTNVSFELEK